MKDMPDDSGASVIDLNAIRLPQNFQHEVDVEPIRTTVPVRKPNQQDFVRVHPNPEYQIETFIVELKEEREQYLVAPAMVPYLASDAVPKVLLTTVNRQGTVALWPIRLPGPDGRLDAWNQSALDASGLAKTHWVRVRANMNLGAYEVVRATADFGEPKWPTESLEDLLNIAFRGRYINQPDHPLIQRLSGRA